VKRFESDIQEREYICLGLVNTAAFSMAETFWSMQVSWSL